MRGRGIEGGWRVDGEVGRVFCWPVVDVGKSGGGSGVM